MSKSVTSFVVDPDVAKMLIEIPWGEKSKLINDALRETAKKQMAENLTEPPFSSPDPMKPQSRKTSGNSSEEKNSATKDTKQLLVRVATAFRKRETRSGNTEATKLLLRISGLLGGQ